MLATLDFLGFGFPPGYPSLGELLSQGKNNLQAPWLAFAGFLVLGGVLTLLIFIGEAAARSASGGVGGLCNRSSAQPGRDDPAEPTDDCHASPSGIAPRSAHRSSPFGLRTQVARVGRPSSDSKASGSVRQTHRSRPSYV